MFRFLSTIPRSKLVVAVFLSTISGITTIGAIFTIVYLLSNNQQRSGTIFWIFIGLCLAAIGSRLLSRILLNRLVSEAANHMRRLVIATLIQAPLRKIETIGLARLTTMFSMDIAVILQAIPQIVILIANTTLIICCIAYMAYFSPWHFLITTGLILCGIGINGYLRRKGEENALRASTVWDRFLGVFMRGIMTVKQIKMERTTFEQLQQQINTIIRNSFAFNKSRNFYFDLSALIISIIVYITIIIFIISINLESNIQRNDLFYILLVIYAFGPLQAMAIAGRAFSEANVSVKRIEAILLEFGVPSISLTSGAPIDATGFRQASEPSDRKQAEPWMPADIELKQMSFQYDQAEESFKLGPLDAHYKAGEMIVVQGETGSGKSTLAKLLAGLYEPSAGQISLNGAALTIANPPQGHAHISAIIDEPFVYEDDAGWPAYDNPHQPPAPEVIERLLSGTHRGLKHSFASNGKRLALLRAILLQNKPVLILDGWAANLCSSMGIDFCDSLFAWLRARKTLVFIMTNETPVMNQADHILHLETSDQ